MISYNDYFRGGKDPFDETMNAYKQGLALKEHGEDREYQLEQREAAKVDAVNKAQAAKRHQEAITSFTSKENKTAKDFSDLMVQAPELQKALSESWEIYNEDQKYNHRKSAINIHTALSNGQTDQAKKMITDRAIAAKSSGDEETEGVYNDILKLIDIDVDSAKDTLAMSLHSVMDDKEFAEYWDKVSTPQGSDKPKVSVNDWQKLANTSLNIDQGEMGSFKYGKVLGSITSEIQEYAAELYNQDPSLSPQAASNMAAKELWVDSGMENLFNNKAELLSGDKSPDVEFLKAWRKVIGERKKVRKLKKTGKYDNGKEMVNKTAPTKSPAKDPAGVFKFFDVK